MLLSVFVFRLPLRSFNSFARAQSRPAIVSSMTNFSSISLMTDLRQLYYNFITTLRRVATGRSRSSHQGPMRRELSRNPSFRARENAEGSRIFSSMGRTNDRLVCRFTSPHHPCGDSRYSPSPHGHPVPERSARLQRAVFHKLPATYVQRDYVQAGSLMSYGSNIVDAYRQLSAMPAASF